MAEKKTSARYKLKPEVMKGIEEHAYSNLTAEVGGMLMGTVSNGTTTIVGAIPALSASAEQVTLTFTHEVWEEILQLAAKEFPNESIVGWYHTHPTFGVFLSDYDLFIQENFFNADGHLALVVDPVQGAYGWFGKNQRGAVEVFEEGLTVTGPRRSVDPIFASEVGAKTDSAKVLSAGALGLIVGLAVGTGIVLSQIPPDLSGALESAKAELSQIAADYSFLQQATSDLLMDPVLEYILEDGDTIDSLASTFYTNRYAGRNLLMAANGVSRYETLKPGTSFLIPSPTRANITALRPSDVAGEIPVAPVDPSLGQTPEAGTETVPDAPPGTADPGTGDPKVLVETSEGDGP